MIRLPPRATRTYTLHPYTPRFRSHLHRGAGVAQAPHQLCRLVGGDAAAHAEQDLAPPELVAGLGHVRKTLRADEATAYPNGRRRPTAPDRATRCNTSIAGGRGETHEALLSA